MAATTLHTEAFVLAKRPTTADGWQAFTLFSSDHGSLHVMQRLSSKATKGRVLLDLFDEASLTLDSSYQGRTWFIKEVSLIARHSAVGKSYGALQAASTFASLLARNPVSPESRDSVAHLLRSALAAFETTQRPEIILLKCLYSFARDEGYPVKQEWLPSLPAYDQENVARLLFRPLIEQTASTAEVAGYTRRLEQYLREHTDILID
jgi:recombinational DNA repair protein (RecF pathway)